MLLENGVGASQATPFNPMLSLSYVVSNNGFNKFHFFFMNTRLFVVANMAVPCLHCIRLKGYFMVPTYKFYVLPLLLLWINEAFESSNYVQ